MNRVHIFFITYRKFGFIIYYNNENFWPFPTLKKIFFEERFPIFLNIAED